MILASGRLIHDWTLQVYIMVYLLTALAAKQTEKVHLQVKIAR